MTGIQKITFSWQLAEIKLNTKQYFSVKREQQGKGAGRGALHKPRNDALVKIGFGVGQIENTTVKARLSACVLLLRFVIVDQN